MRLYVDNLAYSTTEQQLKTAFAAHGTVDDCKIPVNLKTGICQGFGYVVMRQEAEAANAIAALHASILNGKQLEVRQSRQQERTKHPAVSLKSPARTTSKAPRLRRKAL